MRPEMVEWQFLLDENIDPKVATYLDKEGLYASTFEMPSEKERTTKTTCCRTLVHTISSSSRVT